MIGGDCFGRRRARLAPGSPRGSTRNTCSNGTRVSSTGKRASVRLIRSLKELEEIKDLWDVASSGCRLPMNQYAWVKNSAECLCADGELLVVCAGKMPRIAIAPLVSSRRWVGRLKALGACDLYEPLDFSLSIRLMILPPLFSNSNFRHSPKRRSLAHIRLPPETSALPVVFGSTRFSTACGPCLGQRIS